MANYLFFVRRECFQLLFSYNKDFCSEMVVLCGFFWMVVTEAMLLSYLQYSICQITVKVIWASREIIEGILVLSVKTFKFPFH